MPLTLTFGGRPCNSHGGVQQVHKPWQRLTRYRVSIRSSGVSGEIERLKIQGDAIAVDAATMFDRIGVAPGWHCIDLGCGPRGVTDLLSVRCGMSGRVIGVDGDDGFIDDARREAGERGFKNVDFVSGDAYSTGLQGNSFDLVHSRFVASTAGEPEKLLQEAIRLARPGRFVAFQEPDIATLKCYPPHPAWQRITSVLEAVFKIAGANVRLAQELYQFFRGSGLTDVQYRPFLVGFRSTDPMVDYLPATAE